MAKATKKPRPWSIENVRTLKVLVREKTKTSSVARKLPLWSKIDMDWAACLRLIAGQRNQLKEATVVDPMEMEMKLLELRRAMGRHADAFAARQAARREVSSEMHE